jgi:hypothetical protein
MDDISKNMLLLEEYSQETQFHKVLMRLYDTKVDTKVMTRYFLFP